MDEKAQREVKSHVRNLSIHALSDEELIDEAFNMIEDLDPLMKKTRVLSLSNEIVSEVLTENLIND